MAVDRQRKIYQALYPLNIKAHTLEFPIHGIDQIIWILEAIIPTLFVIAIIFMLTQLFAERYQNHLDTAQLYPFSKVTFAISSLGVGVGYVNCAVCRNQRIFFSSGKSDKWFWTVRLSLPVL